MKLQNRDKLDQRNRNNIINKEKIIKHQNRDKLDQKERN